MLNKIQNLFRKIKIRKKIDDYWFEPIDMAEVVNSYTEGEVFIDCGANVGQETVPVGKRGATVYAFEPEPIAFDILKEKVKDLPNVHIYNKAVYSKNGKMKLYRHNDTAKDPVLYSEGSSLFHKKNNVNKNDFVEVEVVRLVDFIKENKIDKIKVLKIDVEGAEYDLLNDLFDNKLHKICDYIFVELHAHKIGYLKIKDDKMRDRMRAEKIKNIRFVWK
ncbi:MAG: methyltransferase [Candidatus Dojkabacteria bacterium]|nr:MAG: methyltransferase [Candidatus Dojkabacteria bacterium]